MTRVTFAFLVSLGIFSAESFLHKYPEIELGERDGGDPGTPLFLTPYIESGNIKEGKRLAYVPPFLTDSVPVESYAGFFTVNKTYDSNQFFWYFPTIFANKTEAPVIVWLQGGPGASSLYGLFLENGPYQVRNSTFSSRKYNWALNHHIIYIDNPVGTGFSFTNNEKGYCTDQTQVGEQLYSTITQFFQLFPELQSNKFFVTGESYAGKYVPALAYTIHMKNPTATVKINMEGLAIGNGLSDPKHQLVYAQYLSQVGLVGGMGLSDLIHIQNGTKREIHYQEWEYASTSFAILIRAVVELGSLNDSYNYIHTKDTKLADFGPMIHTSSVRKAIHVGDLPFKSFSYDVQNYLYDDIAKSVAPLISQLLSHYYVLTYNGQLDTIVPYPGTVNYLSYLKFDRSTEYQTADRNQWKVDGEVAGYVKRGGRLIEVLVRNAGHMVPMDQPKWAFDLITRFTHGRNFHNPNHI